MRRAPFDHQGSGDASAVDVDRLRAAWGKILFVQLTLWSYHDVDETDL